MVADFLGQVASDEDQREEDGDGDGAQIDGTSNGVAEEKVQDTAARCVTELRSGFPFQLNRGRE